MTAKALQATNSTSVRIDIGVLITLYLEFARLDDLGGVRVRRTFVRHAALLTAVND
jgi:hypothetical protein